jgi:tetraacyldisaccharide 4'-kinase
MTGAPVRKTSALKTDRIRTIQSGGGGPGAALARAGLSIIEIGYRLIILTRNALYEAKVLPSHDLGRPTISIGNLTTGGTGKTPLVAMIATELMRQGHHPAVLIRGYHQTKDGRSDEAMELESAGIVVEVGGDRVESARRILAKRPETDVFLLDDGMQHRRARRDLEIVVIDATEPFGFDHLLPRGMLREPVSGLNRADVIVITRAGQIAHDQRHQIIDRVKSLAVAATVFCCDHRIDHVRSGDLIKPVRELGRKPYVVACGIGNPTGFVTALQSAANAVPAATRFFPDHYDYTAADVVELLQWASSCGSDAIVVTGKDWVKLRSLATLSKPSRNTGFFVAELELQFVESDRASLLGRLGDVVARVS